MKKLIMKQVAELLKPRYKVIAGYPEMKEHSGVEVGEILVNTESLTYKFDILGQYPHLFKKLEWWEDRKPEEMPEYVVLLSGHVFKCSNWREENGYLIFNVNSSKINQRADGYYRPATKKEYELNQNKSKA